MQKKDNKNQQTPQHKPTTPERKPNERAGFHLSSSIKITDPNTGEVLVQMRAD